MKESTKHRGKFRINIQWRLDLIPNLVGIVKGYPVHEREVFKLVITPEIN